jgi:hypothetical protein
MRKRSVRQLQRELQNGRLMHGIYEPKINPEECEAASEGIAGFL